MATADSAELLGRPAELGQIAPGRRAEVVVLGASRLQAIRNTRTIELVWIDGVRVSDGLSA